MEVLLGGDGQEQPFDDDRNFSTLEVRVAQTVFEIAAEALHSAFGPVIATKFRLERVETRMDFTVMGRRNVLAVIAKILIQAHGHRRPDVRRDSAAGADARSASNCRATCPATARRATRAGRR